MAENLITGWNLSPVRAPIILLSTSDAGTERSRQVELTTASSSLLARSAAQLWPRPQSSALGSHPHEILLHPPACKAPSGHCVWRLGGMRRASSPNKLLRQTCCVRTLSKTEWKNQDDALIALACVSAFCSMCAISMWCLPWLQTRPCPTTVRGGERSQKTLQVVHLRWLWLAAYCDR